MDEIKLALDGLYEAAYRKGYDQAVKDLGLTEKDMEDKL